MRVEAFDFTLPPGHIATRPAMPRESARMLAIGTGFQDLTVGDLPGQCEPGDLLVFNDTRVIPARLFGRRDVSGARGAVAVEFLLHRQQEAGVWTAFAKPAKRLRPGDLIEFSPSVSARILEKREGGEVLLHFAVAEGSFFEHLRTLGHMPLPPYLRREDDARDAQDYQTLFARHDGAVAAPTAGLHFTPLLLARLAARGIKTAPLTLHVGAGTFLPVKVDDTKDHRMHAEWGMVPAATIAAIAATKAAGRAVIAVGTTSLRLLETMAARGEAQGEAARGEALAPFAGETDLFITPGYRFRLVDRLLSNFHLPRSTLFMLVASFAGLARMQAAYAHAIARDYRFYSYGDCCLIDHGGGVS